MKIHDLFESTGYIINNSHGKLEADWKHDLEDEEKDGYIPDGYSKKVLELKIIKANWLGSGDGDALMKEFLSSQIAKSAELIFLDPNPFIGKFADSSVSEDKQIQSLKRFYKKYGFRNNPKSDRMWLVRKGTIDDKDLPT